MSTQDKATVVRRRIDFSKIREKILVFLYTAYMDDRFDFVSLQTIVSHLSYEPRNAIREEISSLIGDELVSQKTEERFGSGVGALLGAGAGRYQHPVDGFKLTRRGVEIVNKLTDERIELIAREVKSIEPDAPRAPAQDLWEPLPAEIDQNNVEAAVEATQAAIVDLESNNGYSAQYPDERDAILGSLKINLEALRKRVISKGQILEGLIKPLRYIAKKFAEVATGEIAKRAVNFLMMLLGN